MFAVFAVVSLRGGGVRFGLDLCVWVGLGLRVRPCRKAGGYPAC